MQRKQTLRKLVSVAALLVGVVTILGYSPPMIYLLPTLYIWAGLIVMSTGLAMYKFWDHRIFPLLAIPVILYNLASINYVIDHNGVGFPSLIWGVAYVLLIVAESQYFDKT